MYNPANARMVSMAGLKPQTYYHSIAQIYEETKTPPKNIVFAVDSDEAGETFMLEHANNQIEHKASGVTVKNNVASPQHQDFKQLGSPDRLESWKEVKDFNDILMNIKETDVKMNYQPVVLEKEEYFKRIDYDKKYDKATDVLSQNDKENPNLSSRQIAGKIAQYQYNTESTHSKNKKKEKDGIEINGFL